MWFAIVIGLWLLILIALAVAKSNQVSHEGAREFSGEVTGREHREVTLTTGMRHDYVLTVRKDDGETLSLYVSSSVFGSFAVGDRIVKQSGVRWPVKE